MGTMINRRRACGGKSLPYDAEIEYLESSGTQYINTRIAPTVDTDCEFEFQLVSIPSSSSRSFICGTQYWPENAYNFMNANATMQIFRYCYNSRDTLSTNISLDLLKHTSRFDTQNNLYIFDDVTFPLYINYRYTRDFGAIYLFGMNNNNMLDFVCQMRIFSFILSRQGVNILDLIPVRVGNVGYLYDKVSGQLFGNAGTGNFILGPDV